MKRVVIIAPADRQPYAYKCLRASFMKGESPVCFSLYNHISKDSVPTHPGEDYPARLAAARHRTMRAWLRLADTTAIYVDFGITSDMVLAFKAAIAIGLEVEVRGLNKETDVHAALKTLTATLGPAGANIKVAPKEPPKMLEKLPDEVTKGPQEPSPSDASPGSPSETEAQG